jgi:predicted transcriptional regulator
VGVRVHINLDDELARRLDARVGPRRRSAFIAETIRRALDDERRWDDIEAAIGAIDESGHDWDADPAAWVHAQRRADPRRTG